MEAYGGYEKKEEFLKQEMEQGAQNQRINALRNKVDKLRQDLDIIKKERDETSNVYQQLKVDDSIGSGSRCQSRSRYEKFTRKWW